MTSGPVPVPVRDPRTPDCRLMMVNFHLNIFNVSGLISQNQGLHQDLCLCLQVDFFHLCFHDAAACCVFVTSQLSYSVNFLLCSVILSVNCSHLVCGNCSHLSLTQPDFQLFAARFSHQHFCSTYRYISVCLHVLSH